MKRCILLVLSALFVFSSFCFADTYTPESLAAEFSAMSVDDYPIHAEYHSSGNFITMVVQATKLKPALWELLREHDNGADEYDMIFKLSGNLKLMLALCGYSETTVVSTFQLNDGTAVFLLIDGEDYSHMITNNS